MRTVTPERIAFAAAGMAAISLIVAIAALARDPKCPQCAVPAPDAAPPPRVSSAPLPAPVPMPPPDPAPAPPPSPTARTTKLEILRHLVDHLGLAITSAGE